MSFPDLTKLWSLVNKDGECWEWMGRKDAFGYAVISHRAKPRYVHRIMWMLVGRTLLPGMVIDHLCGNRGCVHPEHLDQVTQGENVRRGRVAKAHTWKRGPCKLTEDDIRAIRASEETRPALAAKYGMSLSAIAAIRARRSWKHVE